MNARDTQLPFKSRQHVVLVRKTRPRDVDAFLHGAYYTLSTAPKQDGLGLDWRFTELVARAREPEPHFTIVPVAATGHERDTSPDMSKVMRVPAGTSEEAARRDA